MRTMFLSVVGAACALMIAGCTATGGFAPPSVESVQQALKNACGYELLVSTAATDIAAIVPTLGPGVVTASIIAGAICKAAVPPAASAGRPAAPRGAYLAVPVTVNGVAVHGGFAR